MTPTIHKEKGYKFYFYSHEESRMHIHIKSGDGDAKFWIEPLVALANYQGFSLIQLKQIQKIVEKKQDEIKKAWQKHHRNI